MIKIELNNEKRGKIERLFLEDLVDGRPGETRGWLIEDLDTDACRELLKKDNPTLYQYLYDKAGKPDIGNIKALLLANRAKMEDFIELFGTYPKRIRKKNQPASLPPPPRTQTKELLSLAFHYTKFSNRAVVNNILREMDITVCPYCNRLYITALKRKKVRPQLDHFFPKSYYPYLALCLYNLVPCCGVCNQAKSDLDPIKGPPLLYPYEEEFGEEVVFTLDLKDRTDFVRKMRGDSSQIRVSIYNPVSSSDFGQKVDQQDKRLHLSDLYSEHGDYVADILKSYHVNTKARIEELFLCFPDLFSTQDEVRNLMFMNYIARDQWNRRPLAKLTHDICLELDSLE